VVIAIAGNTLVNAGLAKVIVASVANAAMIVLVWNRFPTIIAINAEGTDSGDILKQARHTWRWNSHDPAVGKRQNLRSLVPQAVGKRR